MKNKLFLLALLALIGFLFYTKLSPAAENISPELAEMELALEKHFDCTISTTEYRLIATYHILTFGLSKDSKSPLSEEEAREYLLANFPSFEYVSVFEVKNN